MQRPASTLLALAVLVAALVPAPAAAAPGLQRVIVVLADAAPGAATGDPSVAARASRPVRVTAQVRSLRRQVGFRPDRIFRTVIHGFSAQLTATQIARLRASDTVAAVVQDQRLSLAGFRGRGTDRTAAGGVVAIEGDGVQRLPTGIRRIKADQDPIAAIGGDGGRVDADVAVLDSGIAAHADLAIAGGINCTDTGGRSAWGDALGHGTHVAGIIGALDNGIGVVGVAPGARLWSVKIIGDDDRGFVSWAVCGLDWVASAKDAAGNPRFEVANMSVGGELLYPDTPCGRGTYDVYHQAVCRVVDAGIPVVVAAGNNAQDADRFRPSAYDEAITVSALADFDGLPGGNGRQADICPWYSVDRDDTFADFSDFGPAVDLIAPGKCIFSTFTRGRYAWMSGTSMATPHVTGAVVLYRQRYPDASPAAIEAALQAAGTLAWATRTDPDGQPDRLLDVTRFMPPPVFTIDATDPVGFLGSNGAVEARLAITRSNGQSAPIVISGPRLPEGLTVDAASLRGASGTITLRARDLTVSGPMDVAVRATDGVTVRVIRLHLDVDAEPPVAAFLAPDPGAPDLAIVADPSVTLDWSVADAGGSELASTTLERVSAPIPTPGSCAGADLGTPVRLDAVPGPQLAPVARCTRWVLTARDGAGNRTVRRTGPVLVDDSAPGLARVVSVSGEGVWAEPGDTHVWVRRDVAGPLTITLDAADAQSGLTGFQVDAGDLGAGWALEPASSQGTDPLVLERASGLVDTQLPVAAVNGAGLVGDMVPVAFHVDGRAPTAPVWRHPVAGDPPVRGDGLMLDWASGTDDGAGIAADALVQRQAGPVSATGDCTGVTFAPVGAPDALVPGASQSGLADRTCVRFVIRAIDRVGNRSAAVTSAAVVVDATAPVVGATAPTADARLLDPDGDVRVTWSATDIGGSGVARTWVQRTAAAIAAPGVCPGSGYTAETGRVAATSPLVVTGLPGGRCYRWTIGARDVAGNTATASTGSVLVDTTAPVAPDASATGSGIAWVAGTGTAWFRADRPGTASLAVSGDDPESGVPALTIGAPAASGWAATPGVSPGGTATLSLAWSAGAAARQITVSARNGAGLTGSAATVRFVPDVEPPRISFSWPAEGVTVRPGPQTVAWTERDTGSGVVRASRSLVVETAAAAPDGTCDQVAWSAPTALAVSGRSLDVTLRDGTCLRWTVSLRDQVGHGADITSATVLVDGTPPVVDEPSLAIRRTTVAVSGRIPLRLRWTMHDVDAERVTAAARRSADGGASWTPITLAKASAGMADLAVMPTDGLRVAVQAKDASGNRSAWREAPVTRVALLEDTDAAITWSGTWHDTTVKAARGGHLRWSPEPGASASATVHGRAVAWVTRSAPDGGVATVLVDGVVVGKVDLARREATHRRIAFVMTWPEADDHTIEVRVDDAHPGRVAVDGFLVLE